MRDLCRNGRGQPGRCIVGHQGGSIKARSLRLLVQARHKRGHRMPLCQRHAAGHRRCGRKQRQVACVGMGARLPEGDARMHPNGARSVLSL